MAKSGWETSVLDRGTWWVGVGNDDEDCDNEENGVEGIGRRVLLPDADSGSGAKGVHKHLYVGNPM